MDKSGTPKQFSAEDIAPVLRFLSKNWFLLLSLPLIGYIAGALYVNRLPDIHGAQTEILLKSGETYDYQDQLYSQLGYFQQYADVSNQTRILSSYDLIKETLDKFDFEVSYYLVGRFNTDRFQRFSAFEVEVEQVRNDGSLFNKPIDIKVIDESTFELKYELNGSTISSSHSFSEIASLNGFDIRLIKNEDFFKTYLQTVKDSNFQIRVRKPSWLINKFKNGLSINNVEYTSILTVNFQHEVSPIAKNFLDSLSETYINYSLRSQISVNENTQKYIDKQLLEVGSIMDSLETTLENFKSKNQILDLTKEQNKGFNSLTEIESLLRQEKFKLEEVEELKERLRTSDGTDVPVAGILLDSDDILKSQILELYNLQLQRSVDLNEFTEQSPQIIKKDSLISKLQNAIFRYTLETEATLQQKIKNYQKELNILERRLVDLPKSQRDILSIERNLKVNENLLVFLLEKKASTVIARAAIIPQTSIIERARSLGVIGPNKTQPLYLGIGLGLVIAVLLGVIRLLFFEKVENIVQLKAITETPILGGIPKYESIDDEPIVIKRETRGQVAEALRSLRVNLTYLLPNKDSNVVLITSLFPSEGKTFVSSNFGAIHAITNMKVVLIDFDMHKPKVHKNFSLDNMTGLSQFLIGSKSASEIIRPSSTENLDIISSGPIPPNASELVMSDKVEALLTELKAAYDLILIDTPPLSMISDSLILMKNADRSILVLNTDKATKNSVNHLMDLISTNGFVSKSSVLLNNIKPSRWMHYYGKYLYKYGYGYSYAYRYGYNYGYTQRDDQNIKHKKNWFKNRFGS